MRERPDLVARLRARREQLLGGSPAVQESAPLPRKHWDFFQNPRERRELYECFRALTKFLHDREVKNIIFMDRAARPAYVGVKECWKQEFPDEPRPGMFFLNTYGFKAADKVQPEEMMHMAVTAILKGQTHLFSELPRFQTEILRDLEYQYQQLLAAKDRPMMLFDACMHSGESILPVKQTLEQAGCTEVLVGTMNEPPRDCIVPTDFFFYPEGSGSCYPFGSDSIVDKTLTSVSSQRKGSVASLNRGLRLRTEIRDLIEEQRAKKLSRTHSAEQRFRF